MFTVAANEVMVGQGFQRSNGRAGGFNEAWPCKQHEGYLGVFVEINNKQEQLIHSDKH